MEKDLIRSRRWDPRKGPRGPDKTGKPITQKKATSDALSILNKHLANEEIDKGLEDELMSQRQGQSGKKWRVTRANKTIGTYNSKDKADVKAMKHPLNKVVSNEEVAVNSAGAGNVAGIGVGTQGEPGKSARLMKKPLKRFNKFIGK